MSPARDGTRDSPSTSPAYQYWAMSRHASAGFYRPVNPCELELELQNFILQDCSLVLVKNLYNN